MKFFADNSDAPPQPRWVCPPDTKPVDPERIDWPDPTAEMLPSPQFEAAWKCIRRWDINVPEAYAGYMGATGNHVRSILDALAPTTAQITNGGKVPDWYHSLDELYEHCIILWIVLCRRLVVENGYDYVWRSKLHSGATGFDKWFILGVGYKRGAQITYHLPLDKWDLCSFARTLAKAPHFDDHTTADVLKRISHIF